MANWVIRRVSDGLFWDQGDYDSVGGWVLLDKAHRFSPQARLVNEQLFDDGEEWVELDDAGQPVEAAKVAEPRRLFAMRSPSGLYHMGCGDWTEHLARAMTYTKAWTPSGEADVMVPVLVHPDGTVTLDEPAPAVGPAGWVLMNGKGFYERGSGRFVIDLDRAATYPCKQEPWSPGQTSVPFACRADGSRYLLDEPAPPLPDLTASPCWGKPAPAIAQPSPYSDSADTPIALVPVDDVQLVAQTSEALGVLYRDLTRMTAEASQLERQRDEAAARLRGGK